VLYYIYKNARKYRHLGKVPYDKIFELFNNKLLANPASKEAFILPSAFSQPSNALASKTRSNLLQAKTLYIPLRAQTKRRRKYRSKHKRRIRHKGRAKKHIGYWWQGFHTPPYRIRRLITALRREATPNFKHG
jgi:hypothetical protein